MDHWNPVFVVLIVLAVGRIVGIFMDVVGL